MGVVSQWQPVLIIFSPPAGATNIQEGCYRYTSDLLSLEETSARQVLLEGQLVGGDPVPLPMEEWAPYLSRHPDPAFASLLSRGIEEGFRIGCTSEHTLKPASGNFRSVSQNPKVVDQYITEEVTAGRLQQAPEYGVRRNPIGIIPKPHQPGKFRLIVDLSSPVGHSINDGISADLCSLKYVSVDQAARLVSRCGRGALMAKMDLKAAYRQVPVHRSDQHLLGIEWSGICYIDKALPFGLRSAPKIFSAMADGLAWAMFCEGIQECVHYLDDFLFWGPPSSPSCRQALDKAVALCERLGFPVAPSKTVGPSNVLTFLGIEIDSVSQELRLPADKLERLRRILGRWGRKRWATKHDLQVLIGYLGHAAAVVRPGRAFMRNLIEASKKRRLPAQEVRLNVDCRADIAWWSTFVGAWNGRALFPNLPRGPTLLSDASGSWGCGAYSPGSGQWFQIQWPPSFMEVNIAVKELLPVVAAAALWGSAWRGTTIMVRSDNQAVVTCLSKRTANDLRMTHLLRCLFFFEAHYGFEHQSKHIAGKRNTAADALS